ncbi:MAG TPA: RND transporter [Desulfobacterales bacterium]|nr:RND transporter [Desulfobacterales bacterium]
MQFIDNMPLSLLIIMCLLLGFAPFIPEPHIVEKIRMLFQGTLKKPLDIFDLLYHSAPFVLLIIKLIRMRN